MLLLARTGLCFIVISAYLFTCVLCEGRRDGTKRTDKINGADLIMRGDAEEIFYNVDVDKYEDEGIRCSPPNTPTNGYLLGEGTRVGSVLYVKCNDGFWLSGPVMMACTPEGNAAVWTPSSERECIKGQTFFNGGEPDDRETINATDDSDLGGFPPFVGFALNSPSDQGDDEVMENEVKTDGSSETETEEVAENEESKQVESDQMPSLCYAEPWIGPCRASLPRFYFDTQTMTCEKFIYGGCQGNQNNFETVEECMSVCKGDLSFENSEKENKS